MTSRNLKSYEQVALGGSFKLSDGHPRQRPTSAQMSIIAAVPDLFAEVRDIPFDDLERQAHEMFFVIEDSGKLWPTSELKAGFLAYSAPDIPLRDAFSDILLTISPLVLTLIGRLAADAEAGGFAARHELIAANRVQLRSVLADGGLTGPPDPQSRGQCRASAPAVRRLVRRCLRQAAGARAVRASMRPVLLGFSGERRVLYPRIAGPGSRRHRGRLRPAR
jgi:hypothetical protein